MKFLPLALFVAAVGSTSLAENAEKREPHPMPTPDPETAEQNEARLKPWRDARFGMFIHWGIYAVPGRGEWVQYNEQIPQEEYAKFADQFKPTAFNADEWVATAKAAGMKYMVLTARHHDGFAMFDTKAGDFSSRKTGLHRDYVAEFVPAVRRGGLLVGLYYSPLDWRFPGYFFPDMYRASANALADQFRTQMTELLTNYGPLDVLWFDGGGNDWLSFGGEWKKGPVSWRKRPPGEPYHGKFSWPTQEVYTMLRQRQPQIVINGRADMPEDFHSREGEGKLGDYDADHPWELCTTLSGAWGWVPDQQVKPLDHWVRLLANAAGRDGNMLLNVGPRPDGVIDPPQVERLREIGGWLADHGESIYGTRGGPYLPGAYGVSTHTERAIYIHVLDWPVDGLRLPALPVKIARASVLPKGSATFRQNESAVELDVPAADRSPIDTVIKLDLDAPLPAGKPIAVPKS